MNVFQCIDLYNSLQIDNNNLQIDYDNLQIETERLEQTVEDLRAELEDPEKVIEILEIIYYENISKEQLKLIIDTLKYQTTNVSMQIHNVIFGGTK